MTQPNLFHVDVFASQPLTGNGLTVFLGTEGWTPELMQQLTQEMKHFESIFLSDISGSTATARIFTVEEELPFAGHPVLGAAAVLHRCMTPEASEQDWLMRLAAGDIPVKTQKLGKHFVATMNQGAAIFGQQVSGAALNNILDKLGLQTQDLAADLPAQVVSTGLPYLIVPVKPEALPKIAFSTQNGPELETLLAALGARFVFMLDVAGRELRTWDNLGRVEDVATGSAAGPAAAYLFSQQLADPNQTLELAQGRFAGRPSKIRVKRGENHALFVSGEVWPVSHGVLDTDTFL
ncbi:MAG: PhzF family phenazine biosynthesis protein [Pseudomonadota bacterium]